MAEAHRTWAEKLLSPAFTSNRWGDWGFLGLSNSSKISQWQAGNGSPSHMPSLQTWTSLLFIELLRKDVGPCLILRKKGKLSPKTFYSAGSGLWGEHSGVNSALQNPSLAAAEEIRKPNKVPKTLQWMPPSPDLLLILQTLKYIVILWYS